MESLHIPYRGNKLHGIVSGEGKELMVCLHGFGESGLNFSNFFPVFDPGYRVVCLDLPLHGETNWKDPHFLPADMSAILDLVLDKFGSKDCILMGYSMGARIAMCSLIQNPGRISRLILLAPDGLKPNYWQNLASTSSRGNRVFRYFVRRPAVFFGLMGAGRLLGVVGRGVYKFVKNQMDTPIKREQVYLVWTCMKSMFPDIQALRSCLEKYHIPLLLVFGKYDGMIPPSLGIRYFADQPDCDSIVVDKGHQLILPETAGLILEWLQNLPRR